MKKKIILTSLIFVLSCFLFIQGVNSIKESSEENQYESLRNAIERDIVYCYANEGFYPESLDYIKDKYGLTYDESLFYVDYKVSGKNLYPDFTIIKR